MKSTWTTNLVLVERKCQTTECTVACTSLLPQDTVWNLWMLNSWNDFMRKLILCLWLPRQTPSHQRSVSFSKSRYEDSLKEGCCAYLLEYVIFVAWPIILVPLSLEDHAGDTSTQDQDLWIPRGQRGRGKGPEATSWPCPFCCRWLKCCPWGRWQEGSRTQVSMGTSGWLVLAFKRGLFQATFQFEIYRVTIKSGSTKVY